MIAQTKTLFLAIALLFLNTAKADSCEMKISLITCGTGEELYSGFGHTAIRVQNQGMDIVFNYGTFNFDEPDFYLNFVRGRLKYYLSAENWMDFLYMYQLEKRNVYEQELKLSCEDKKRIFSALRKNIQDENKYYAYDFLKDNCTSRAASVLEKSGAIPIEFKGTLPPVPTTYRKQIHETLHRDGKYWSALGIDILMGLPADEQLSVVTYPGFLPFNLMEAFDHAYANGIKVTDTTSILMDFVITNPSRNPLPPTPLFIMTLLLAGLLPLHLVKTKWVPNLLNIFDRILFFTLGLLGLLLLFLIFFTDHKAFALNFNLLWALPTHLVIAFSSWKSKWIKSYFKFLVFYSLGLMIVWAFLPQELNIALIPLVAWVGFRSYYNCYARPSGIQ